MTYRKALRLRVNGSIVIRMINNYPAKGGLLSAAIATLCACGQAAARAPAPLQGVVEYDDRIIGFELAGRVTAIDVKRGDLVAADARLVRLDDSLEKPLRDVRAAELATAEAQLRLLRAGARGEEIRASEAEISALRAQEAELQRNLTRQQALVKQAALAQNTADDTASQLQATEERRHALEERLKATRSGARGEEIAAAVARVRAATAALAAEEARLDRYELHNPVAGSVIDLHVEIGEVVVPASPGVTVADLGHPYVDVFVPQARAHELSVGQAMSVRVDGVPSALHGRIEHMFPKTEFTPRFLFSEGERPNLVLRTRVRVDDPQHQLHGGVPAFVTPPGAESVP
jgi:HlyD family secretion protein